MLIPPPIFHLKVLWHGLWPTTPCRTQKAHTQFQYPSLQWSWAQLYWVGCWATGVAVSRSEQAHINKKQLNVQLYGPNYAKPFRIAYSLRSSILNRNLRKKMIQSRQSSTTVLMTMNSPFDNERTFYSSPCVRGFAGRNLFGKGLGLRPCPIRQTRNCIICATEECRRMYVACFFFYFMKSM